MTRIAFLTHILFASGLFALSCMICLFMVKRIRIMDIPNDRSSHDTPIPKSGGIVIVITFLSGVISIYLFGDTTLIHDQYFFGFLFSALLVSGVSLYDDITDRSFFFKLITHIIAAGVAVASGIMIHIYGSNRIFIFIPFLLFQILYSVVIVTKARKKGLM